MKDAMGQLSMYELMHSDGAAPTLADATTLTKAKAGTPWMIYQACQQARQIEILLMVIIGEHHPLLMAYYQ